MKCLFIINPVSGSGRYQKAMGQFFGKLIVHTDVNTIDQFFTKGKDDAFNKAKSLKPGEYDFVVSVGGDGTLNECISGLYEGQSGIPLAVLPSGTTNDFANCLELPDTPSAFARMIKDFNVQPVDVGKVDDHYFANVLSGGMFSDIAFQVPREDKDKLGPMAYYLTALKNLPSQLAINMHLDIKADGQSIEEDASLFMITNSSRVGGFDGIAPLASVQDGKLDLFIIKKCNVAELLAILSDYGLFNKHTSNAKVDYLQASHFEINCNQDIVYDIDGEMGKGFPIEVQCIHHAVNLLTRKKK